MKLLVIGSGGREHALVWKLAQSPEHRAAILDCGGKRSATPILARTRRVENLKAHCPPESPVAAGALPAQSMPFI